MENEDSTPNVYALFPGIDTAPFGPPTPAAQPEPGDEGWSALPTRTIAAGQPPAPADKNARPGRPRRRRHPRTALATPAIGIAAALIAGAAFAAGRAVLAPTAAHTTGRIAAAPSYSSKSAISTPLGQLVKRRALTPARRQPAARSAGESKPARHRATTALSTPAATRTVTVSAPAPPPPLYATSARSGESQGTGAAQGSASQRPGPTGPVSLIGAGTTPSG